MVENTIKFDRVAKDFWFLIILEAIFNVLDDFINNGIFFIINKSLPNMRVLRILQFIFNVFVL